MKYKIKKTWPGCPYKEDEIVDLDNRLKPEDWPEYFEKVYPPIIYNTEDFMRLYSGDVAYIVCGRDYSIMQTYAENAKRYDDEAGFLIFAFKENAEDFVKKHKKQWTDWDMIEFAKWYFQNPYLSVEEVLLQFKLKNK